MSSEKHIKLQRKPTEASPILDAKEKVSARVLVFLGGSSALIPLMNRPHIYVLLIFSSVSFRVEAQRPPGQGDAFQQNGSNFQPSLAVVMGALSLMFIMACILLVYVKFCLGGGAATVHGSLGNHPGLTRSRSQFSGIDKAVIESLPFFRFSSLRGSKEGLECAVCLSKFEDVEILRLLPQCKHAFHIQCIDRWLEDHSSCPLCRFKLRAEDPAIFTYSDSIRLLFQSSRHHEDLNLELFVEREEEGGGSSRFTIGSSFRRIFKASTDNEEEFLIRGEARNGDQGDSKVPLHKFNHKILVPDAYFKNRWSNVSSSDLMFLSSEMLGSAWSNRFSSLESNSAISGTTVRVNDDQIMKIKEEMEIKRLFESKLNIKNLSRTASIPGVGPGTLRSDIRSNSGQGSKFLMPDGKRSTSEIKAVPRLGGWNMKNRYKLSSSSSQENSSDITEEEKRRRLWLPIARRTVEWFANRERRSQDPPPPPHQFNTRKRPDV